MNSNRTRRSMLFPLILVPVILQFFCMIAVAAEISGKVVLTVGPYILLKAEAGNRVIRTDKNTAYGNIEGVGSLKQGGDNIVATYDHTISAVPVVTTVTKETVYVPAGELSVPLEQFALDLDKGKSLLIDVRTQLEWDEARIPGAILSTSAGGLKGIDSDISKEKQLVFVGSSAGDLRPYNAARAAVEKGYVNVKVLAGGISLWRKSGKTIIASPAHLATLAKRRVAFRLIDLHDPASQTPILPGAEALPLSDLTREKIFLPQRAYQLPLFLYGTPSQAREAARQILAWGYHQDGDLFIVDSSPIDVADALQREGVSATTLPGEEVDYQEFKRLWEKGSQSYVLLNVKPERDRNIPDEVHIPLEALPEKIGQLPRDREILVYCKLGIRSAVGVEILKANGFRARFLNRALQVDKTGNLAK